MKRQPLLFGSSDLFNLCSSAADYLFTIGSSIEDSARLLR